MITNLTNSHLNDENFNLYHGDTLEFLHSVPDGAINLIVTSPPYNVGKEYEVKTSIEKYLERQEQVIRIMYDKLAPDGSICWQVGNYVDNGENKKIRGYHESCL